MAFSIPEIAPELSHKMILLADRCGGEPLSAKEGPYKIIEEDAKQLGRWVRQVTKIRLLTLPATTDKPSVVAGHSLSASPAHRKQGRGRSTLWVWGPAMPSW